MPITRSAIKKQRVDRARTKVNKPIKSSVKSTLKAARATPTAKTIAAFYSAVDIAVKKHLFPKRSADRLKSRLVALSKKKSTTSVFGK